MTRHDNERTVKKTHNNLASSQQHTLKGFIICDSVNINIETNNYMLEGI